MTDPLSLSVNIIAIIKQTYLVGKFIYKSVKSAKHSEEERADIASQFRWELLAFQSFGHYYSASNGVVVKDTELDERWKSEILTTLSRLSVDFSQYEQRARLEDEGYQAWCDEHEDSTTLVGFEMDSISSPVAAESSSVLTGFPRLWRSSKAKMREVGVASKWAVWDRKTLETTIAKFQKRNARLQEILQIATATQQLVVSDALKTLLMGEDAKTLGLAAHAEIRQIVAKPGSNDLDFNLQNVELTSDIETRTIHSGKCTTQAARGNTTTEPVLIEYKDYASPTGGLEHSEIVQRQSNIQSRIYQLASLLHSSGANHLGTLPFKGIVHQQSQSRHAFLFHYPISVDISAPESLHSIIDTPSTTSHWPLGARFKIAQDIAKSIGAFHADGWVHKSVRSHSIVFFRTHGERTLITDSPYLVDFEYSRPETGSTLLLRDNDDEKNLYRHPEIQDVARSSFSKSDDIYSLGVVLLEIALWQTARSMLNSLHSSMKRKGMDQAGGVNAIGVQKMYVDRAKKRVGHLMGSAYQNAVLACLESKYRDQTSRHDFPIVFHDEVTTNLSVKSIG